VSGSSFDCELGRSVIEAIGNAKRACELPKLIRFGPYHGIDVVSEKTNTGFGPLMKLVSYWNQET
jgi:hypothetical protein